MGWRDLSLLAWLVACGGVLGSPARAGAAGETDLLNEGFEGTFPPPGWTHFSSAASPHTWHTASEAPYVRSGASAVRVLWQDERVQDERITTVAVDLSQAPVDVSLSFWWYTDPFWFGGGNVLRVQGTLDGISWPLLWEASQVELSGWLWRNTIIPLGQFVGQTDEFRIRFRYLARDAADFALDDVRIGSLAPAFPPENDDCAGASANGYEVGPGLGSFVLAGDNTLAGSDYPLATGEDCVPSGVSGNDLVWFLDLPAGHAFHATMTTAGQWDDTLFLVADCGNPIGTCVAGNRTVPDGSSLSFVNPTSGTARYWLVASAFAGGQGEFTVTTTITDQTAVQPTSWGAVKARYR